MCNIKENGWGTGYKRILSKKSTFLHLLHRYVEVPWLEKVTEQDLELIDKEFILTDFQEREADIVYKIRRKDGRECYVYILLELQSSVDYTMPFRLLIYMTELLKRIFENTERSKRERKDFHLPPIMPIVLYNGEKPWTAVRNFREYFETVPRQEDRLINFRYGLVDINAQDEKYLLEMNTLLENIFLLDRSMDEASLDRTLKVTSKRVLEMEREDDQIGCIEWVRDVLSEKLGLATDRETVEEIIEGWKKGDEDMMTYGIERAFDNERRKARRQGIERGIEQGIERGKAEGKAEGKKEVAIKLFALGLNMNQIIEATGLSAEELQKLTEENNRG